LQREAKKAQTLAHPNIVTVYDFDRDGAMVYLTMELLSGRPLRQLLRDADFKGMPYAQALPIVTGIAKALAYAHERGFVHCDLKPANVFLTDHGEVKVIDFGIARVFRKPEEDLEATVFDAGSLGGMTPTYASAEMLEHRDPDPRDDIYALGCITYELLTGRHPFDRLPATQARSAKFKPQRPKDLGRRQWRALREALAFDREKRTPTVPQFLHGISGERRAIEYVAMAGSAIAVVLLVVGALAYYWEFSDSRGTRDAVPAAPAVAAAPPPVSAAPVAAPRTSAPPVSAPPVAAAPVAAAPVTAPPVSAAPPRPSKPAAAPVSVASILAGVPCSALAASARDEWVVVQGYLPATVSPARLKEMLGAAGVGSVKLDVRQVKDDDCGVINALAPYWRNNRESGGATTIHTKGKNEELREGDSLIVDITTPGFESYVSIDYYVLDGSVIHLVPSPRAKDNQAPANYSATVGSVGNWVVAKPFGSELIVLLTTPVPLFDAIRPEHESRGDYLRAVEKRLTQLATKYGPERLTADFVQVTTRPKP
jgi:hypothetical protein